MGAPILASAFEWLRPALRLRDVVHGACPLVFSPPVVRGIEKETGSVVAVVLVRLAANPAPLGPKTTRESADRSWRPRTLVGIISKANAFAPLRLMTSDHHGFLIFPKNTPHLVGNLADSGTRLHRAQNA